MAKPVWSGIYVYRSLVDSEVIRKLMPEHRAFTGSGQLLSVGSYFIGPRNILLTSNAVLREKQGNISPLHC